MSNPPGAPEEDSGPAWYTGAVLWEASALMDLTQGEGTAHARAMRTVATECTPPGRAMTALG